jgi:predicted O-methyltransferase YrrM
MESKNKYRLLTVLLSISFIGLGLSGWFIFGEIVLIFALGAMLGLLMIIQIESHHRIQQATQQLLQQQRNIEQQRNEIYEQFKQIESLFSIFYLLRINHPLPSMGGWAISPDFGKLIVDLVLEKKPKLILEASSGVSTLIASYCLKQLGEGTVISLEEENKYAEVSNKALIKHGLKDIATVIHAPLEEIEIEGKKWTWYALTKIKGIKPIDMLIIDGPVQYGRVDKMIRYPALPLLFDSLSDDAIIILDDADRKDEKEIVELWLKQFNCFEVERIDTEKGTVILHRKKAVQK